MSAQEHIWCDNCDEIRPLLRGYMPADERNDHAATDLICSECHFLIATLHHLTLSKEAGMKHFCDGSGWFDPAPRRLGGPYKCEGCENCVGKEAK